MRNFSLKLLVVGLILFTILPALVQAADEVGVFNNGQWAVGNDPATATVFGFGWADTIPIVGDWNGDGKDEAGVYNPAGNNFLIQGTGGYQVIGLGWTGVTPVVGDWNGDGRDEVGVFDNGQWAVGNNPTTTNVFGFGWANTKPIIGDWNGDGKDEVGVYNPSGNNFLIQGTGRYQVIGLGWTGVVPLVGDWALPEIEDENFNIPTIISDNIYTFNDYTYVVGEIKNYLSTNIEFAKIVVTFYDESGNIMGTGFTYTPLDIIEPGQKSPFEISTYPGTYTPASYKLQGTYRETYSEPYNGLEITSSKGTQVYGSYGVIGEIVNNGDQPVEFVKVVATFYDSSDKIIGTDFTYASLDVINPGETSPFELGAYKLTTKPARYELQVQGRA